MIAVLDVENNNFDEKLKKKKRERGLVMPKHTGLLMQEIGGGRCGMAVGLLVYKNWLFFQRIYVRRRKKRSVLLRVPACPWKCSFVRVSRQVHVPLFVWTVVVETRRIMMEINREDERPDVIMTVSDKDAINEFSRHLARKNELKNLIARRKKLLQLHEDAGDELLLMDDDTSVHYAVGDTFLLDDKEQIEATLDATKAELGKDIDGYELEMRRIGERMRLLKANLYAKFGKTINLEE